MTTTEQKCKLCRNYIENEELIELDDEILKTMEFLRVVLVGVLS